MHSYAPGFRTDHPGAIRTELTMRKEMNSTVEETPSEPLSPLDELRAMKRRLDRAFYDDATPPRDLAAISRRLLEVGERIRTLEEAQAERENDASDEQADAEWTGV